MTGFRRVITKANATMGVATLEDLQGTIEVVVFPKLYEQTAATWPEGAILLVAGRVDHRGEEVSLLADLVVRLGRGRRPRAGGVRARGRGGRSGVVPAPPGANGPNGANGATGRAPRAAATAGRHGGNGHANGTCHRASRSPSPRARAVAVAGPGRPVRLPAAPAPRISPLRPDAIVEPARRLHARRSAPADPIPTYAEPPGARRLTTRTTTRSRPARRGARRPR